MVKTEDDRRVYPERIGSSTIGRKWICDEGSRLTATGEFRWPERKGAPTKTIAKGSKLDDWLKDRPKSYDEKNVRKKLDKLIKEGGGEAVIKVEIDGVNVEARLWKDFLGYAASRMYAFTEIVSHWDDFHTYWNRKTKEKAIWQVENKGLTHPSWIKYESPAATLQVRITQWVWQPVWKALGWGVKGYCWVEFYDLRNFSFLERRVQAWNLEATLEEIEDAFDLYDGIREPILPATLKCKGCQKKSVCTVQDRVRKKIIQEQIEKKKRERYGS